MSNRRKAVNTSRASTNSGASQITIVGRGKDGLGRRYVKIRVGKIDLPPFPLDRIATDPSSVYSDLVNAGASLFTLKAKRIVLEALEAQIADAPVTFRVAIPLPSGGFGIYEQLHGFKSGGELSDALKKKACTFFGTPRLHFAKALQRHRKKDKAGLRRFLRRRRREYLNELKERVEKLQDEGTKLTPPLERASGRFATVFAAGALAIRYETFPVKRGPLLKAILSCQIDGLIYAASKPAEPQAEGPPSSNWRNTLMTFLRDNRFKFVDLDAEKLDSRTHTFGSVPGYFATHNNVRYIYLTNKRFIEVLASDSELAKAELAACGQPATKSERFVVQRRIFSNEKNGTGNFRTVCAIKANIMDGSD